MKKVLLAAVLLALPAFAGGKAAHISQHKLDTLVRHWQGVLMLTDWEIRAKAVSLDDLPEGTMGCSMRTVELRVMTIWVLDPADYAQAAKDHETVPKSGKEILRDIEDTVVHELMHLRLRDLMAADTAGLGMAEEVTVNRMTTALLSAGRR